MKDAFLAGGINQGVGDRGWGAHVKHSSLQKPQQQTQSTCAKTAPAPKTNITSQAQPSCPAKERTDAEPPGRGQELIQKGNQPGQLREAEFLTSEHSADPFRYLNASFPPSGSHTAGVQKGNNGALLSLFPMRLSELRLQKLIKISIFKIALGWHHNSSSW